MGFIVFCCDAIITGGCFKAHGGKGSAYSLGQVVSCFNEAVPSLNIF